ncbi:hypothetical protein RZO55_18200 [Clostridium boliviensis]|uniref:Uncharacterized protein n=1 Tax=Clostridium boliviensis TaxID=318465 RepID=A0ABU4GPF2_9CLOT|nr:hypothetical protein [Clostridium boliviensis]MDW2799509.1 hypothetical protein [Clostridium boliviensis]
MYKKSAVFSYIFICCIIISGCQRRDLTYVTTNTNEYVSSNNNIETKNQIAIDSDTNNLDIEKVELVIENNINNVFEGNIGNQNICMAIYRDGEQLSASYITQNDDDGEIKLQGKIQLDNASFILHNENNNIIFSGTIKPDTKEGELLDGNFTNVEKSHFSLVYTHAIGNTYETRYSIPGTNTEDIEKFAKKIKEYIIENNKQDFAELIDYPINIKINEKKTIINSAEEFEKKYDDIINSDFKHVLSKAYTKYLDSNPTGIMLANGKIWINYINDKEGLRIFAINN